jgi:hypothetical protein
MFLLTFIVLTLRTPNSSLIQCLSEDPSRRSITVISPSWIIDRRGLYVSLPLGYNQIEIQRGLTTSSVAIFIPFTTQELFQTSREALYCGLNALSNNLIMVDRKLLKNPNGLILGTPGSGKSFAAKREISNVLLSTVDDVIVCDPESEYGALSQRFHGQVIRISPTSED